MYSGVYEDPVPPQAPPSYSRVTRDESEAQPEETEYSSAPTVVHREGLTQEELTQYSHIERVESIFEDPSKFKNANAPNIITPVNVNFLENYFIYLVVIFHEIPALRNLLLSKGFELYGYRPNWWKDEIVSVSSNVLRVTNSEENLKLLLEIQRLVAFLDGKISERLFACAKTFVRAIPSHIFNVLEKDSVNDVIPVFYQTVMDQVKVLTNSDDKFHEIFESSTVQDGITTTGSIFQIEADYVRANIYETFHSLFWKSNFQNLGATYFDSLSDIITVAYHELPEDFTFSGLVLEEEFYPQIYTKKYNAFLKKVVNEQVELVRKIQDISRLNNSLVSFQGKRINSLLEDSAGYLESVYNEGEDKKVSDALNELKSLHSSIQSKKADLAAKCQELEIAGSEMDIYNIGSILSQFQNLNKEDEELPYLLTGIIVSESEFYYRLNETNSKFPNQWVHMKYDGDPRITSFSAEAVPFKQIRRQIKYYSIGELEDSLVLLYTNKALLTVKNSDPIPSALAEFLQKDNEQLNLVLEENDDLYTHSSDESQDDYVTEGKLTVTNQKITVPESSESSEESILEVEQRPALKSRDTREAV